MTPRDSETRYEVGDLDELTWVGRSTDLVDKSNIEDSINQSNGLLGIAALMLDYNNIE